jgi:hypothetical protein
VSDSERRWIARLTPPAGSSVAPESCLAELERRRLAEVDRWATQQQYEAQVSDPPTTGNET